MVTGLRRETAAGSALLPRVLRRGSTGFPDLQKIAAALDESYGARIEPVIRKKGELHCTGLYADFADRRFIPGGEDVLAKIASLLGGMLLSPDMTGSLFRTDYVESEKQILIDDIRASVNDKRGYSISRLLEEMCSGEFYSVRRLGSEEEALRLTPERLTEHYGDLISNSGIKVFYCGSEEPERIVDVLRGALHKLPERTDSKVPETAIMLYPPEGSPRTFTEKMDVVQGKLAVGFRLGKTMKGRTDLPALLVFNTVYGAGDTSKLFLNIREKLSLCYYVGSVIDKHKGLMVVSSGLEFDDFEKAVEEIQTQLEFIKAGQVSEWELTAAKRSVVTSIKQSMDRPGGLEEIYFDSSISRYPYDPDDLCDQIGAVTLDRIVETASEIGTDSIFFLTGE